MARCSRGAAATTLQSGINTGLTTAAGKLGTAETTFAGKVSLAEQTRTGAIAAADRDCARASYHVVQVNPEVDVVAGCRGEAACSSSLPPHWPLLF